jgi:hypothetical protein
VIREVQQPRRQFVLAAVRVLEKVAERGERVSEAVNDEISESDN